MKFKLFLSLLLISLVSIFLLSPLTSAQDGKINLEDGLVTYLKLDNEDKEITDETGNLTGEKMGTTFNNGLVEFDGEDDFIELKGHDFDNIGYGTISLWFKAQDIPIQDAIRPILYYGAQAPCENMPDASNQGLIIEVAHDPMHFRSKNLYFTIFADGCEYPSFCYDSRQPMEENKWYHFVALVGEDYNTGYLNGKEMTNRRYNFGNSRDSEFFEDAVKDETFWIGKGYWDAKPMFFKGNIKNIRIYNRVLNETEINHLYENEL